MIGLSKSNVLQHLWSGVDFSNLICCQCNKPIGRDAILARTFTLGSRVKSGPLVPAWAERIEVPSLSDAIAIYHRHLACLLQFKKYATVSHVWHSDVARLQYTRDVNGAMVNDLTQVVLEQPVRIFRGILNGNLAAVDDDLELWHDYVSVPQWQPDIKSSIIEAIPKIYNHAAFVLLDLHDVEASSVHAMRNGSNVREVACGISDVCNAKYWSRMWTMMEFTESKKTVAMLKDYIVVEPNGRHKTIMHELHDTWNKSPNWKQMEVMVGIGNNLCPWQLGRVTLARDRNLEGKPSAIANAHDFLCRRCVTNPRDFFYALLAILKLPIAESSLFEDDEEALLQVARECLRRGDYSCLLMAPRNAHPVPNEAAIRSLGYLDLRTFDLGAEEEPATYKNVEFTDRNPVITAENMGQVTSIVGAVWGWEANMGHLTFIFQWAHKRCGQDVEAFVHTVVERLFGQPFNQTMDRLAQEGRMEILKDYLSDLSRTSAPESAIDWQERARTLADVLGLSNTSVKNTIGNPLSPIDWLSNHGYILHLGEALTMKIIDVTCEKCRRPFLLRVAPYSKDVATIMQAQAYRIPGLKFGHTLAGGAGLLIKNGRPVGRFLWGTPTCECEKLEKVEVILDSIGLPEQNTCKYGVDKSRTSYYLVGRGEKVQLQ